MTITEAMNKRYSTKCPHCGHEIHVTRSLGMLVGLMDTGLGTCPHCNKTSAIKYNPDDTLTAFIDDISTKINLMTEDKSLQEGAKA